MATYIQINKDKWKVKVSKVINGKRYQRAFTGTLKDCKRFENTVVIEEPKITLNDFFYKHLLVNYSLKETTERNYMKFYSKYLEKPLGNRSVDTITAKEINRLIMDTMGHLQSDTRGKYIKYILSMFVKMADVGIIEEPLKGLLRVSDRPNIVADVFSQEELQKLLSCPMDQNLYEYIYISINTGCRIGEVLALTKADFKDNGVYITKSKNQYGTIDTPKSKAGTRFIPLLPNVYQKITNEFHIDFIKESSGAIRHRFYTVLNRAGIRRRRPHDLRHTFATQLIIKGAPVVAVSKLMGHASTSQTLNTYTHATSQLLRDSIQYLKDVLPK